MILFGISLLIIVASIAILYTLHKNKVNNTIIKTVMEEEYVIVIWPESQILMDEKWFNECVLITDEPLLSQVGPSAYFVPKSRIESHSKD